MSPKIRFILVLGIIIFGIGILGYFRAVPGAGNQGENLPKIEITPKSFDFGEINYGQIVNYTFRVKNLGKAILEIKRVATSCACTSAKIASEKINPGQETELLVIYDTGAMAGAHGKGQQERIIYVKSSDPINPQVEAMIYAAVR